MKLKKSVSVFLGIIIVAVLAYVAFDYFFYDDYDDYGHYSGESYSYDESYNHNGSFSHNETYEKPAATNINEFSYFPSRYGSAGKLDGKTVIVSIFADDRKTSWKNTSQKDKDKILNYLGIAVDFLQKGSRKFGADATFIYDWKENADLYYEGRTSGNLMDEESMDGYGWELVHKLIDSENILKKYNAENIVYLCLVNSPASNDFTSCTRSYDEAGPYKYPYEICYMYTKIDGQDETPSGYAHEILHAFGAPDLYAADYYGDNYGITEKYVNWCKKNHSNDIMYTIYNKDTNASEYDFISNEFTELDAYYTGIAPSSEEVERWGFRKCLH